MRAVRLVVSGIVVLAGAAYAQNGSDGIASFHAHRYSDAQREIEAAVGAHPNDSRLHQYLGRIALHETRFRDAITHLERAVELEPSAATHRVWLGRAYGQLAVRSSLTRKFGLAKRARAALERAVELDPSSIDARTSLVQFYLLAPRLVGGSTSKARTHAAELAKQSSFHGALARAWIAEDRKDYDAAAREYRQAIALAPDSLIAYWGLAQTWQRGERFDSSFALMEELIRRRPDAMPANYYYGRTSSLSGEHLAKGMQALQRYIAYEPHEGEPPRSSAHYRLGLVYERMGEREKARREFETSLSLEPTRGEVKSALAR